MWHGCATSGCQLPVVEGSGRRLLAAPDHSVDAEGAAWPTPQNGSTDEPGSLRRMASTGGVRVSVSHPLTAALLSAQVVAVADAQTRCNTEEYDTQNALQRRATGSDAAPLGFIEVHPLTCGDVRHDLIHTEGTFAARRKKVG